MALEKQITIDSNVTTMAYKRVENIRGDKTNLNFDVITYFSKENTNIVLDSKTLSFIPSSEDNSLRWDKQIYEHLKTFPENEGWQDVLETSK